jgi:phosphoglycerate dehydrogenase-like enzyme
VQLMSAGFDTFDMPALQARGVLFANSSASIAPAVAEHAITLMLAIKRELVASVACVRGGVWQAVPRRDSMSELAGATVGIVGLGHIGREVAKRLVCWDCKLLYADAVAAPPEVEARLGLRRVSLEELLAAADVVTLHVPLNAHTQHLMNAERLRLMKSDAILINTCRGPVVDEAALYRALSEGWIAAAGLDVLEIEPAPPDNPLLALDNVVVTPHLGGSSVQRVRRASEFALENVERFLAGETPLSLVRVQ